MYEQRGDDFCSALKGEPSGLKMLAKRDLAPAEAGFALPSFSQEVMNGKCDCNSCTGGKFSDELKLEPGTRYYFLVLGEGKGVKIGFIPPPAAKTGMDNKSTLSATSSSDPLQRLVNQKPFEQLEAGESVMLKSVTFDHRSTKLAEESDPDLERLYKFMKNYPKAKIEIQGHVDGGGKSSTSKAEEDFALKLSEERAKAVKDYLVKRGIGGSRIAYKGYGTSQMVYFGNIENILEK
jgi:outer membrane protein OmpA-like peptidoglycan-associated protein